jgi:hypothetical protein
MGSRRAAQPMSGWGGAAGPGAQANFPREGDVRFQGAHEGSLRVSVVQNGVRPVSGALLKGRERPLVAAGGTSTRAAPRWTWSSTARRMCLSV